MFGLLFKLFASLCMQFSEIDVYHSPGPGPGSALLLPGSVTNMDNGDLPPVFSLIRE